MGLGSRLIGTALLVGGGLLAVGLVVAAPSILRAGRPAIRSGLKRGMQLYAQARTAAAELIEDVEDLIAEVQSELTHERPTESDAGPKEATGR
jgi:hypothetical protein